MNKRRYVLADFETKITENFRVKEFACKDNTPYLDLDLDEVQALQDIRNYKQCPIIIVSEFRSENHNIICGGAKTSKHLTGDAIDFRFNDENTSRLVDCILTLYYKYNYKRIGLYINRGNKDFIHFDNGDNKAIWVNDGHTQKYYNEFYDYLLGKKEIKSIAL